jgi:hypothetical protein
LNVSFETLASPRVNPPVPEFDKTYAWGARPHPFRTGGPAVNSGPPLRLPRTFLGVRGFGRWGVPAGPLRRAPSEPPVTHLQPFRLSDSLPQRRAEKLSRMNSIDPESLWSKRLPAT